MKQRLKLFGFYSYAAYLRSEHWRSVKDRYRESGLLQGCIICRDPNVDLHHKTYLRLGDEKLTDLFPLCRHHHEQLHDEGLDLWRGAKMLLKQTEYGRRENERSIPRVEPLRESCRLHVLRGWSHVKHIEEVFAGGS